MPCFHPHIEETSYYNTVQYSLDPFGHSQSEIIFRPFGYVPTEVRKLGAYTLLGGKDIKVGEGG
ncbi:hypothetical protein PHLCEN_2v10549 [Hermanssonia centrifuga]|uniref:Uncharacterized protein n=1 Tax=Hermanssonia centrifuga TaxID=98765 RepID=A0A2R6NMQ0_9APHY|nr:hypothetical protein PHLCEN_2v10549 [Hermanssonia centrifuga]